MRFLCFHGLGTNSEIFEFQTSRIREELGGDHEFDFIDAGFDAAPANGVEGIYKGPFHSWFAEPAPTNAANIQAAMQRVRDHIAKHGPYDAAMGFSQGTSMLTALLLDHAARQPPDAAAPVPPLFRLAIFFSGGLPEAVKQLLPRNAALAAKGPRISIPTAHILGGRRDWLYLESLYLASLCRKEVRVEYEHAKGHVIPFKRDVTVGMASAIRRCINLASRQEAQGFSL